MVDAKTFEAVGSIPIGASGHFAFTPDGAFAYAPLSQERQVAVLRLMTPVQVTIKSSGSNSANLIDLSRDRMVKATIFSTPAFDARTIDPRTVTLAGAPVKLTKTGQALASLEMPASGEGTDDLVLHFEIAAMKLSRGNVQVVLEGKTYDGMRIKGTAAVTASKLF